MNLREFPRPNNTQELVEKAEQEVVFDELVEIRKLVDHEYEKQSKLIAGMEDTEDRERLETGLKQTTQQNLQHLINWQAVWNTYLEYLAIPTMAKEYYHIAAFSQILLADGANIEALIEVPKFINHVTNLIPEEPQELSNFMNSPMYHKITDTLLQLGIVIQINLTTYVVNPVFAQMFYSNYE